MSSSTSPHVLVFPYPAQGHIIPLLDLLHHLPPTTTITIIVTPKNAHLLSPPPHPSISLLILPLPSHPSLPAGAENVKDLPNASFNVALAHALSQLHHSVLEWVRSHWTPPTALLSDFFLGSVSWDLALDLGIPHFVFYCTGALFLSVMHYFWGRPEEEANKISQPQEEDIIGTTEIPGLSPSFPTNRLPSLLIRYKEGVPEWECMKDGIRKNFRCHGAILNTFEAIEGTYLEHLKRLHGHNRVWAVGPISPIGNLENRGGATTTGSGDLFKWLDSCPPRSVVYISFGSQFSLPPEQVAALAEGLESSGVHFIWCLKESMGLVDRHQRTTTIDFSGFEERTMGKGTVVRGWAPQVALLGHVAIGAFVTHCGWNSIQEGLVAGVTLLTWPMEADQFVNAKVVVDDMKMGARIWEGKDSKPDPAELGRILAEAVGDDKSGGNSFRATRERAMELGRKARLAVTKGGSSEQDINSAIKQLCGMKSSE